MVSSSREEMFKEKEKLDFEDETIAAS